ncbi:hypothetical protein KXD40_006754 [Peronospora effusa]|nr:hypothetical protein KXD40_006754 [Peronospora effusa]
MRSSVYPHDYLIKLYATTHCSGPHTRSTFTVYISTTGRRLWIGDVEECDDDSASSGLTSVQDATQYVDQVQVRLRPVVAPSPTTVTVTHALFTEAPAETGRRRSWIADDLLKQNAATTAQRHVKDQSKSDFLSNIGTSTPEKRVADGGYKWERVAESIDLKSVNVDNIVENKACRNLSWNAHHGWRSCNVSHSLYGWRSSTVLLLTLGATFNDVSKATNLQQAHRDLSDTTYSQTDALATALLSRVNKERVAHGLPVICSNKKLQAAAQRHVKDQSKSDFMSDFGTDDSTPEKRVADAGYKWERVAENIDSTNADVDAVVDWWMKTQSRDNLLGNFTMIGSAYAYNENTSSKYFWVQVYATGSLEECDAA